MSTAATERAGSVEFRVLGPVEVVVDGQPLALEGRKSREALSYLLLHANESVSQREMIEALWGDEAPLTVDSSLRVAISKLRKTLAQAAARDWLETHRAGYRLCVEPELVDAARFEALSSQGHEAHDDARWNEVETSLAEALALWRGDPYQELVHCREATTERRRLTSRRLDVQDDLSDAQLGLGRHETLVPELEALVSEQPTRERRAGQLMLALYRAGRQAEALDVYTRTRDTLNEELGLEPGRELRELQQAILVQSPALSAPARPADRPLSRDDDASPPRRARRRRTVIVAAAACVVAALAAGFAVASRRSDNAPDVSANSVALVTRPQDHVAGSVATGGRPIDVVLADGSAWIANAEDETVSQVDIASRRLVRTIGIGFEPTAIAAGAGAVWVVGGYDHRLSRIDTDDGRIRLHVSFRERVEPLPVGYERGPAGVAVAPDGVWVSHGVEVTRFDPRTGAVERTVPAGGPWSSALAVGQGFLWVGDGGTFTRSGTLRSAPALDAVPTNKDGRRAHIRLVADAGDIDLGAGWVWVTIAVGDVVWRIDPGTQNVDATFAAGDKPVSVAVDDGVWISNGADATVTKLDERSGERLDTIPVGHTLEGLAASGDEIWVAVRQP